MSTIMLLDPWNPIRRLGKRVTISNLFIMVVTAALLLGLILPADSVSADNGANWGDMKSLVNSALDYISKSHADIPAGMQTGINWCITKLPNGYQYSGGGCVVTIDQTDTVQQTYEIKAQYQSLGITWTGIARKGAFTEISYSALPN